MAIFLGLGINGAVAQSGGTVLPAPGYIATVTNPAAADAVFDSGASVRGGDRNAADITLSGTTDAGNGAIVEVRWIAFHDTTDVPTGAVGPWQEAGVAAGGAWSGTLTAPRNVYTGYRAEARVRGSTAPAGRTPDRFFVGHVMAVWNQSNAVRVFDRYNAGQLAPEPLTDPLALTIYRVARDGSSPAPGTVEVYPVNDEQIALDKVSAASVALSNTLAAARPGERFAIAVHAASGTSPFEMIDPAKDTRKWGDEVLLHDAVTHGGATQIGSAWVIGWGGFDGGPGQVPKILPVLTGKLENGTPVAKGETLTVAGLTYTLTNDWRDIYDLDYTRIGNISNGNPNGPGGRWAAIHADNVNFPEFLDDPRDVYGSQLGRPDAAGTGWNDGSHFDTIEGYDGAVKQAKLLMNEMLRMIGLLSYDAPEITHADFTSGTHIDLWNPNYDVTTWRNETTGDTSPFVSGFVLNGAPITTEAQLVADAGGSGRTGVRITPTSGVVTSGYTVEFGSIHKIGIIDEPQDLLDKRFNDLPMMNVGQSVAPAMPILPRPSIVNNLPQSTTFTRPDPTGSLLDPSGIGAGTSALTVQARVKLAPGGGGTFVGQAARGAFSVFTSGGMNLNWQDAGKTNTFVSNWNAGNTAAIAPENVWTTLTISIDMTPSAGFPNGVVRIWSDKTGLGRDDFELALAPNVGTFEGGRQLAVMGMPGLEVEYFHIWKAATATEDTTALGTPDKAFTADAGGNMVQTPLLPNW